MTLCMGASPVRSPMVRWQLWASRTPLLGDLGSSPVTVAAFPRILQYERLLRYSRAVAFIGDTGNEQAGIINDNHRAYKADFICLYFFFLRHCLSAYFTLWIICDKQHAPHTFQEASLGCAFVETSEDPLLLQPSL